MRLKNILELHNVFGKYSCPIKNLGEDRYHYIYLIEHSSMGIMDFIR